MELKNQTDMPDIIVDYIDQLDSKHKLIIYLRLGIGTEKRLSYKEIGATLNVNSDRVKTICNMEMLKILKKLNNVYQDVL